MRSGVEVAVVLVVVQAKGLLTRVPRGLHMVLVAPDACELTAVEAHLDAAVRLAQDAGGLVPIGPGRSVSHRGLLSASGSGFADRCRGRR